MKNSNLILDSLLLNPTSPFIKQEPSIDPSVFLTSTPSEFCNFGIMHCGITKRDLNNFTQLDLKLRKRFGAFRYFVYPLIRGYKRQFQAKIRYAVRPSQQGTGYVSLCLFTRTAHSAHSLHSAPLASLARSVHGLAHSLCSLPRGTVEIDESAFTLKSRSTSRIAFAVVTRNTPLLL